MKIAKDFYWEMSHRLPWHNGLCKNIHGHTYRLNLALIGTPIENGMVLDYYDISKIVLPIVQSLDHSFLCEETDALMLEFLQANSFKHIVINGTGTAENIINWFAEKLLPMFSKFNNIEEMVVRIYETTDTYAEKNFIFKDRL